MPRVGAYEQLSPASTSIMTLSTSSQQYCTCKSTPNCTVVVLNCRVLCSHIVRCVEVKMYRECPLSLCLCLNATILTPRDFLRIERRVASTFISSATWTSSAIRDELVMLVGVDEPANTANVTTTQVVSLTAADVIIVLSNEQRHDTSVFIHAAESHF